LFFAPERRIVEIAMGNKFKDTLFRSLLSDEKAFLSLYNAVSGSKYGEDTAVVINTLSETLFTSRKGFWRIFSKHSRRRRLIC
jgi:hypothetical protein